ncbi:MAG: hypothetical protein GWP18_03295, partial [Proteobacteria bacterium]|nr:hypothetical protein [Pseudomonadota bacterium]
NAIGGADAVSEGQGILDWFRFVSGAFSSMILVDFGTAIALTIVVLMTGGAALLVLSVDREPHNRRLHLAAAGVSIAGSLLLVLATPVAIGGLLAATPFMLSGLVLVRSPDLGNRTIRLGLVASSFFVGAVFVTQEKGGGGAQWGGRYLMVVLPILVPIAIFLIRRLIRSVPEASRLIVVPLVVASLVLTIDAALVLRSGREHSAALTQRLVEVAQESADSPSDPGIVLSSRTHIGRHAWRTIDEVDYFLVPDESFDLYLDRLVDTGVARFAVVGAWTPERRELFESYGFEAVDASETPFVVVERFDEARRGG